jgi:hypothetical protein
MLGKKNEMIDEKEMFSLLNRKVPEIRRDIHCIGETGCAYKMATFFAKFTGNLIKEERTDRLRECLELAEEMLNKGDYIVKNAIENIYIFSVSRTVTAEQIKEFSLLYKEFKKQVFSKCI